MEIDAIDKQILKTLQRNGKIAIKELAQKVNLSTTPVFQRVKRLEKNGIIAHYAAIINPDKLGPRIIVFAEVNLKIHKQHELEAFEKTMESMREVLECHHITGKYDYLLKISVRDMTEYRQFIMDHISKIKNIDNITSSIALKEVKKDLGQIF